MNSIDINITSPEVDFDLEVAGERGKQGLSAYEIAVKNGFIGTEQEWLDSFVWKTTVTTGSTNGTIAVDGNDVAVKGLGSAAYTDSTAYAAASHSHSYLPLSGGTLTGVVNGVTPTAGDNSTKIATTAFVNAKAGNYLPLSGGTATGNIIAPSFQTGNAASNYFQCKKFRGEGNVDTYYHAIDFGYGGHNQVDFYEYGGVWNFHKCTDGNAKTAKLVGAITASAGWNGLVKGQDITTYAKKTDLDALASKAVPTGVVQAFAGSTTPQGWLLCDGSAVSRTDYAALFNAIGTTYGSGDGSSTFNLPNLTDRFIEGNATAGTVKSAGLPNITGTFGENYTYQDQVIANGAVSEQHYATSSYPYEQSTTSGAAITYSLDASRSSAIYGKSTTVQPPALTMRYIIKY